MSSFSDYAPGPTLYWPAGTSARWRLALRQCRTCPALDLTDAQEVEFIFKRTPTTPDASALFTKKLTTGGIVAADLALGLVDVIIDDSDTSPADGYSDWIWLTRVTLEDGTKLQPFGVSGAARLDALAPAVEGILAADSTTGTIAPVALTPAPLPAYATVAYVDAGLAGKQPLDADLTAYANAADSAARRALINAPAKPIYVDANVTALFGETYEVFASATFTDPASPQPGGYEVRVRNGTATIGGTAYTEGTWWRVWHSGSWSTRRTGFTADTPAAARDAIELDAVQINGLHGLYDKLEKVATNDPANTLLTTISFGDSLRDRVAGHLHRVLIDQYSYGNNGHTLGVVANPEQGSGAIIGNNPTFSGGAAYVGMGTNYALWPTGDYILAPSGSTAQLGNTADDIFSWHWAYLVEPGAGTFELETSTNGTDWTSRGSYDAAGTLAGAVATYDASVTRLSRVRVTAGTVKFLGQGFRRSSARGTVNGSLGVGGLSIANAALTSPAVIVPILTFLSPDVVTVHMDDDATLMATHLPTVIGWFRAANPRCSVVLIGNGPKSGLDAEMFAQNAYMRALALANPGYAFVDGMQLLKSYAWMTTVGWQGDGTHLADQAYFYMARQLIDLATANEIYGRVTRPFVRHGAENSVNTRQIALSRFDRSTPAATIQTDGSFGFDAQIRMGRSFDFTSSNGATLVARLTSNELVHPNQIPPRVYMPNMSGSLGSQYTGPATGGVLYITGNEIKWRNAATGIVYDMVLTGSGSPEGVVTAVVGKLYTRTDGGAGTTLYVKESGTGNTGWVAK
jgi:hypothetical protein